MDPRHVPLKVRRIVIGVDRILIEKPSIALDLELGSNVAHTNLDGRVLVLDAYLQLICLIGFLYRFHDRCHYPGSVSWTYWVSKITTSRRRSPLIIPREARAPRPCCTRIRVHGAKENSAKTKSTHPANHKKTQKSAKWHSICTFARDMNIRKPPIRGELRAGIKKSTLKLVLVQAQNSGYMRDMLRFVNAQKP